MPLQVLGGRAPYAISIKWGDGTDSLVPRNDNNTFKTNHTYEKPGTYQISIQATDDDGRVAFITVAAIVNGQPEAAATAEAAPAEQNLLLALWPLYIAIIAIVTSFWLGERRERHVLEKRGLLADVGYEVNDEGQAPPTPAKPAA
jgi:hypothetical protein